MNWIDKVDAIFVINLLKREDRMLQFAEQAEKYLIPYKRYQAIENPNGAEGLKDTMVNLFNECLDKGYNNVLVFEDDAECVEGVELFHLTMDSVVDRLPHNYIMIFLGCQLTGDLISRYSPSLIKASKLFSTHAVMYSKRGMKEILNHNISAPIDNFYVATMEAFGETYCTTPLLFTQRAGYSDICCNEINWTPFIVPRFNEKVNSSHI